MPLTEPAANWHLTRRHYSTDLRESPGRPGRTGHAICNGNTEVHDQAAVDGWARSYARFDGKNLADIALCKSCAKIEAKR